MRTMNFDAIAASAPLDRAASVVRDGSGDQWAPAVNDLTMDHWSAPPLQTHPKPNALADLSGARLGRLTVVRFHGYREGKNAPPMWLVRCSCGDYEARRNTTVLKRLAHAEPDDCCALCLKADQLRKRNSSAPTKSQLRKQRKAFNRIVSEASA